MHVCMNTHITWRMNEFMFWWLMSRKEELGNLLGILYNFPTKSNSLSINETCCELIKEYQCISITNLWLYCTKRCTFYFYIRLLRSDNTSSRNLLLKQKPWFRHTQFCFLMKRRINYLFSLMQLVNTVCSLKNERYTYIIEF